MLEIEAKVRLSEKEMKRVKKEVSVFAKKNGVAESSDIYFATGLKNFSMRVRKRNGKSELTFKNKHKENGIESNDEVNIPLKDGKSAVTIFKKIGLAEEARKEKTGEFYKIGDIQIEINKVRKLGYFLEIEILVNSDSDVNKAKKRLNSIFEKLGYSQKDFENKSYLELLAEKKLKKK